MQRPMSVRRRYLPFRVSIIRGSTVYPVNCYFILILSAYILEYFVTAPDNSYSTLSILS